EIRIGIVVAAQIDGEFSQLAPIAEFKGGDLLGFYQGGVDGLRCPSLYRSHGIGIFIGCPADDLHRGGHAQIVLRLLAHVEGPYIAVQVIRGGAHQNGAARVQTDKKILGGRVPETLLYGYPYVVVPPLPGRIGQGQSWGQKAIEELVLVIAYRSGELEPIIQK